jgi:MFS family permease
MILFGAAIVAFGFANTLPLLLVCAGAIGFFMIGLISGLYAIIGTMYPARVRNTGTGLALGVGRIGAVVGPYLGGILIAAGYSRPIYTLILCAPLLIAALLVLRVPLLFGGEQSAASPAK